MELLSRLHHISWLGKIVAALAVLIILLAVFQAGVFVGYHRAIFASDWTKNYDRNFGNGSGFFGAGGPLSAGRDVPNPHGATGKVVSVSLPTFTIVGQDQNEKTVRVDDRTLIRSGSDVADTDDITVGTDVTVLGKPDADTGQIVAAFIRIMPSPIIPVDQ